MSFPKTAPPGIQFSAEARKDLRDILRHTDATWGERQLFVYRDKLDEALRAIGDNPKLGHHRDDLPQTHQAYLVGSHIIIYRQYRGGVGVVRILHQRMSLAKHV